MLKFSIIKMLLSFLIIPMMMQCEDDRDDCLNYSNNINTPDLLLLTPEKLVYSKNEVANLKCTLPSKQTVAGKSIDIFQSTKSDHLIVTVPLELLEENTVTVIKGQKINENTFHALYNSTNDSYELNLNIALKKTGVYSFDNTINIQDKPYSSGQCPFVNINTNIKGKNSDDGRLEFFVN